MKRSKGKVADIEVETETEPELEGDKSQVGFEPTEYPECILVDSS